MADAIDTKVVKMKFDNEEFDKKTSGTLSVLQKLKESLKFDGASKGLNDVSAAAKTFSMDSIGLAVDSISSKFSAMGAAGFTVINNLTNQVIGFSERMAKELTIAPINDGFKEYETNMTSIQTILGNTASKGTTLQQVSDALDVLNGYADQTIYSFGEMTKNIGTFTAAGVDLDKSVSSIKGIGNLAAITGTGAEDMARVSYQLSQAMSSGTLKAQDWLSVTNAGGMGGEIFQKNLFETAKALGTITDSPVGQSFDEWKKAGGNFRDAMSEGVFTADVLTLSLQSLSGDLSESELITKGYTQQQATSILEVAHNALLAATEVKTFSQLMGTIKEAIGTGWADSFKYILGNFEQAKELFSSLYTVFGGIIGASAKTRNDILKDWMLLGGRTSLIQSLRNVLWSLASVFMVVQKAFRDAFPRKSGLELAIISEKIQEFTKKLIPAQDTLERLGRIFGGVFSILSIGWGIIKAVVGVFFDLFGAVAHVAGAGGGTLELFAKLGDALTWLKRILIDDGGIKKVFSDWLTPIFNFVRNIDIAGPIKSAVEKLQSLKDAIVSIYQENIAPKLQPIVDALSKFKDMVVDLFSKFQKPEGFDALGDATGRLSDRWETLTKVGEFLGKVFEWVGQQVQKGVEWFKQFIPGIADAFKSGDFNLLQDALNVGLFAALYKIVSKFLDNGLLGTLVGGNFMKTFKGVFTQLQTTLKTMQQEIKAEAIMKIAEAMLILTAALAILSMLDSAKLTFALAITAGGFVELSKTLEHLNKKIQGGRQTAAVIGAATAMVIMAGAILLLALAVKLFSMMSLEELAKGIGAVDLVMLSLATSIRIMGKPEHMLAASAAIIALSVAVSKLIKAISDFGQMDMEVIKQGLFGVSTSILLIVAAIRLVPEDAEVKGLGIAFLALALMGLAKVVEMFGTMQIEVLVQGLLAFASVIAIVTLAVREMGDPKRMLETAAGIGVVAIAIVIMAKAIQELGATDHLLSAVLALGATMFVLVLAVRALNGKEAIEGAATIVIIAAAIAVLTLSLMALSEIGVLQVLALLFGIVVFLGILAIGALFLTESGATAALAAFASAVWVLGLGLALSGLGVLLFAGAIYVVVLAIKELSTVGEDVLTFIPKFMKSLADGAVEGMKSFLSAIPDLLVNVGNVISAVLTLIQEKVPEIVATLGAIVQGFADYIANNFQTILDTGWNIMRGILQGIADHIFEVVMIVGTIVSELLTALTLQMPTLTAKGAELLVAFLNGLTANVADVVTAVSLFILTLMLEIDKKIPDFVKMGAKMAIDFINAMGDQAEALALAVSGFITKLMEALAKATIAIAESAIKVATALLDGIANAIEGGGDKLDDSIRHFVKAIIKGLANGLSSGAGGVKEAIQELASDMLYKLTHPWEVRSPSRVTTRLGKNIAAGLAVGIKSNTDAADSAGALSSDVMASLRNGLSDQTVNPEVMWNDTPTIKPVLDLTDVKKGANDMNNLWKDPSVSIDPKLSTGQAVFIAKEQQWQAVAARQEMLKPAKLPAQVSLHQTINAPHALSANDIYRQTKSQLALAKEELNA